MNKSYTRAYKGTHVKRLPGGGIAVTKVLGRKEPKAVHRSQRQVTNSPGCFPAQTRVLTPTGWQAISTIEVGTKVLSHSSASTALVERTVTAVKRYGASNLLSIGTSLDRNRPLQVTASHSFLHESGAWVRADQLNVGARLIVRGNARAQVAEVTSIRQAGQADAVFNLITEQDHTFVVQGGLVAHNFSYFRNLRKLIHRLAGCLAAPAQRSLA